MVTIPSPERLNGHPAGHAAPDDGLVALSDELSRGFAQRAAKYDDEAAFPVEDYEDLKANRLTAMNIPAEYGGLDVHPLTYALVLKNIARGNASTALTLNMHSTVSFFVRRLATEEQKRWLFGEIVRDGSLQASASSEPTASFRGAFAVDSTAEPVEGGYRVNAMKHFCSLSTAASYYMTWTVLPDSTVSTGSIYLAVPSDSPGVEIVPNWDTVALRSTESHSVRFTDVFVPAANQIGGPSELITQNILDRFALGYSAVYLGVAEAAFEFAREYAMTKSFAPDPRTISHHAEVQNKIAEMSVILEAANCMLGRAATAVAEGDDRERTLALNQAKYFVGDGVLRVTELAFKLVGGRSIFRQYPLERHMRDARAAALMPPSNDKCLETVGKTLLGISAATIEV